MNNSVINKKNKKQHVLSKYLVWGISVVALICIILSFAFPKPFNTVRNGFHCGILPIEKGLNDMGQWFTSRKNLLKKMKKLQTENKELKEKIEDLTESTSVLAQDKYELERLRTLLELQETYSTYDSVGAHVIAKSDTTNIIYGSFTIDKGSNDGIKEDMNVISGSGLVGIVTQVGPSYAIVRSIIDDNSNVSAMVLDTSDNCFVSGDLELMTDRNMIELTDLEDPDNEVVVGGSVVTSNISSKFLPGILIGYISELNEDSNKLTKSGTVTPVVDFKHLQEVLVILELKEVGNDNGN